ncbi:PREDICTED: transcription termination factor 2 [Gekko japonicus]|uniref:Transcription termination factor 2 n=1 Tax=Gekko japonicus TaxID=146911 RepID=A0ABM1LCN3_GEKJA|nr:PREDICTED: transcription termination factor 2 [Gekko japonicus]
MEKVLCAAHGFPCFLKTGIKDGPNKNKSFYVCGVQGQPPCGFVLPTQLCPSHCLMHEEYVVDLQVLIQQQGTDQYRLFYRCAQCKKEGKKWCGSVPWQDSEPTRLSSKPQSQHMLDLPINQRNPFKVSGKNQQPLSLKQIDNYEDKNSEEKDERETLDSDKKHQQKSPLEYVEKELPKESKIKFGDKSGRSSSGEKEGQTKLSDLTTDRQETVLLNTQKSCSSKKAEVPSGHVRQSSSMRTAEDDLQKQETSCSSQTSSKKPLNEEQLGKGGSESCIDQGVREKMHGDGGSEKTTVTPRGLVTICECTGLPVVPPRENPLLHGGMTPEEKLGTNKNTSGDEHNRYVPSKSPVGLVVDSLHGKDCSQKKSPSISQGSAPSQRAEILDSKVLHNQLSAQLRQKKSTLKMVNVQALPDKGERLLKQVQELEAALSSLNLETEEDAKEAGNAGIMVKEEELQHNPFRRTTTEPLSTLKEKGPQMFNEHENTRQLELRLPAGSDQYCSNPSGEYSSVRNLYGGRMTEDRLRAVYSATTDAINQLHKSLKSCPMEEAVTVDPPGLKVSLLLHQKQALTWLLWRENQLPCGGILADDMGLGKTLTMIALVLTQKQLQKEKKVEICMSRQDSSVISSNGTLIVCPASLIHHWKKEIERHVSSGKLRVCLYHGPNRSKNTAVLSGYDIVITTYGIIGKEIPTHEAEEEVAAKDHVVQDKSLPFSPLLWINWARIILDEAHSIRNPKVQGSIAACKLRATARWAITGTPIQNNLLDMYSLIRFLHCSPFDEFKVWKSQVDNNTRKGGERLAILTRSLLLRRTKDQLDSSGKPLVSLPQRLTRLHRLKLSGDEQLVYDVLFTRSRSTLQSYLKRQEAQSTEHTTDNPFERVAQQFRDGQQDSMGKTHTDTPPVSTTVHILSLLLRLRQCCCHLSLLKTALEQASLDSEGISLSLEEQLSAMTLSEPDSSDPRSVVYLLGSPFGVDLFEITRQSTKLSHLLEELKAIQGQSQKSVVVSQWTSMLKVVTVHLEKLGLKYATVDGSVNPKQRMDVVEEFNRNPKGPQVMLISLLAGGVGLNLIGGNHLFLLDMHWNPALEDQACDRIYRVGQRKDVVIHRFVCEGTVEEKISDLQASKKELAQKVLSGRGDSFSKLTLADLKLLFGI